ncbi:hypothetical protein J2S00_003217 [Caldalkalibacillus uzonensis]|uniref:Endolytic transglycosylase MltG n=1 Tax=Caldalkalibacillus uzonensis TaxID=353224 RepID=A0ABU0CVG3_9BACI|nr:hypothetical protein [Caldalkalibacillus uzonensis]MDQ0340408.1 hypothetical protein [Caldalkalibacillus uzonensis]
MNQVWIEALGKEFKKVLNTFQYPPLTQDIFTSDVCKEWRSILSGLPASDEALKQQMTKRLLKSTIVEIEDMDQYLLFHVKFAHKGELYQAALKLANLTWGIDTLQYTGKDQKNRLIWGVSITLVFALLIASWLLSQKLTHQTSAKQTSPALETSLSTSQWWDDEQFVNHIDVIQQAAEQHGYLLLTEEELETLVDKQVQDSIVTRLAESEEKGDQQEETSNPEESETDPDKETVELTIQPGMTSPDIASQLVAKGLARNEREVIQLFRELDVDKQIRSGTYTIPRAATYMDVIDILTGR